MDWIPFLVSLSINGVLGIMIYLLKSAHIDIKDQLKEQRQELDKVKENKMAKDDFKAFEDRLWNRLDRLEDYVKQKD